MYEKMIFIQTHHMILKDNTNVYKHFIQKFMWYSKKWPHYLHLGLISRNRFIYGNGTLAENNNV